MSVLCALALGACAYEVGDERDVDGTSAALSSVDSSGGEPEIIASSRKLAIHQGSPDGLAVDATHVYWADFGGHAIRKIGKL
ncbi:MAG TPA: hypothetical protein VHM19_02990 [Polyangiales bacterium]|nr:hypothetical protein [Polyangiales bacterium]